MKRTEEFLIYKEYWYVVNFKVFHKPQVLPIYFVSRKLAVEGIKKAQMKSKHKFFKPVKGANLPDYNLFVNFNLGTWRAATKHDYPDKDLTRQEKKNIRTMYRRRLRRMGILSTTKPKGKITDKPKYVKAVKNAQKVATSPNSEAKVIQMKSRPSYIYYYLVDKAFSHKSGKLFRLTLIRINVKSFEVNKVVMHTRRHEIFKPFLVTEFKAIINERKGKTGEEKEALISRLKERGIKFL